MIERKRILAVDDNATNLLFYEELLEDDFELVLAESGEEALETLDEFKPDVILLDIMMPGIDGYEVCRRVRQRDDMSHVKVILVSAKNQTESRLEGYHAGADDYIIKPFDQDEMLAKLAVYMKLKTVEELDGFKTDLMSRLGTEMLTPLSGILAPLHYVMDNDEKIDAPERVKTLARVQSNAQRLQRLIEKTLVLGAIRTGTFSLNGEVNSLEETVARAIDTVTPIAVVSEVKVLVDEGVEVLSCFDHERLYDIAVYVLENAIQASEAGAKVIVSYGQRDAGCFIRVIDEGHGIAAERHQTIFDFLSSSDPGVLGLRQGISLHLSREILQAHGGDIQISSKENVGTECLIEIRELAAPEVAISA